MPRLAEFETAHPEIRVDLLHRAGWPDLRNTDVAIVWFKQPPSNVAAEPLFDADCIPVSAPGLVGENPLWESGLAPLHYRDRGLWQDWLAAVGGPQHYAERGEVFDDPNLVLEAAVHRRGVAMGFLPFIADQLASGRLQRAHAHSFRSDWRYWLIYSGGKGEIGNHFLRWLKQASSLTVAQQA
jgi:LysR family glycine cleavage system transcriptional activator